MAEYGGGSPCGGVVYKEDAWPEKYRGRRLLGRVGQGKVQRLPVRARRRRLQGRRRRSTSPSPATSSDFRPLDLALSYDGKTLYVADWGMGGWGSKTEKVGRVFAITYKGDGRDPPARQGLRPDRRPDQGSSTTPRSTSGCGPRRR